MNQGISPDVEALVRHEPVGHKAELRLWLRLLSCSNLIANEIRRRLRTQFGITMPQFDLMAQLYREPAGLRLGELSARMMVTNGNITGLVDRLEEERLVRRRPIPEDRRVAIVELTQTGTRAFGRMAEAHEAWIAELLDGVGTRRVASLTRDLRVVKDTVRALTTAEDDQ